MKDILGKILLNLSSFLKRFNYPIINI